MVESGASSAGLMLIVAFRAAAGLDSVAAARPLVGAAERNGVNVERASIMAGNSARLREVFMGERRPLGE